MIFSGVFSPPYSGITCFGPVTLQALPFLAALIPSLFSESRRIYARGSVCG
jgi:hypothetical protein